MKYLIFYIVMLIVIASYGSIGAIWMWVSDLEDEAYIAMASGVIALIALGFAIVQGWQNHKHNRLSVRPLLSIGEKTYMKDSVYRTDINLTSKGTGPAIIKTFILRYDSKVKSCDNLDDYGNFIKKELKGCIGIATGSYLPGALLKAGDERVLVGVGCTSQEQSKKIKNFINRFDIYIEYQSIYEDEVFIYDSETYREGDGRKFPDEEPPIIPSEVERMASVQRIAKAMAVIHAACFTVPRPWTVDGFTNLLENPNVFHIKHKCGFAIGRHLDETQTELLTLAIIPYKQGKGQGHDLLNEFIAEVADKGRKSIFLEVAENNAPALRLYEKADFKTIGLRPAYYEVPNAPNINAVLMRLDITE